MELRNNAQNVMELGVSLSLLVETVMELESNDR
jgi:hypothetical protein